MVTLRKARTLLRLSREEGWYGVRRVLAGKLWHESTWKRYSEEATDFASSLDFSAADVEESKRTTERFPGSLDIGSLTWFIPDFDHPYYGGIHTALRFAQYYQDSKGVATQFAVVGGMAEDRAGRLIEQAFPSLSKASIHRVSSLEDLRHLKPTDGAVATLWTTAYYLLRFNATRRKFYFLQDYEPLFYPAGSTCAQVEATYSFGFLGIANTPTIGHIYEERHGGDAEFFVPCVDTSIFRPAVTRFASPSRTWQVFFYGRPQHPRNGFELGAAALRQLKERLGDRVRIVSAGAAWKPRDFGLAGVVGNLGLLSYTQTAELCRNSTVGLVMMFTRHPSYLPLELMAGGCLVVSNHNPATTWLLKHNENCLLSEPSATCLAETLERALTDATRRERIVAQAATEVQISYGDWEREMEKVYQFICDPTGERRRPGGPSRV